MIYVENDSLIILQELALVKRSTVATYDKSWNRDIYNIWVDRHNKCVNCMGEYFDFFTSNCYVAVKGYNVKPL